MRRLLGMVAVIAAVALASTAAQSGGASGSLPMLSQIDVLMIEIEDLDGWMASHRTRVELREMNGGMRSVCEELRKVEAFTGALAQDPQFREDKGRVEALRSLQASMTLLSTELSGWQATLQTLARTQGTSSQPATEQDRQKCQTARADIAKRMASLEAQLGEVAGAMKNRGGRPELSESAVSLTAALQRLGPVVRAMDRLNADPGLDRDCLSQIGQAQDRLSAMVQQIESCRNCLAGMVPKS